MKIVLIFCLLFCSSPAIAFDKWTTLDTALEATFALTMLIDRNQTVEMNKTGKGFESGWARMFIGEHPRENEINKYFAVGLIGHATIAYILPKPYRTIWQSIWIGIELNTIHENKHNVHVGIKVGLY